MYYVGDGQKVRYFRVYVTLSSKYGSFLIVRTKNDVRYVGGHVILKVRYFGSRLYLNVLHGCRCTFSLLPCQNSSYVFGTVRV
jgi:hypothetical protein